MTPFSSASPGRKNRKGSLGSYYAIADYRALNPEFGTESDFRSLVNAAHRQRMKVILDWVPITRRSTISLRCLPNANRAALIARRRCDHVQSGGAARRGSGRATDRARVRHFDHRASRLVAARGDL